MYASLKCRQAIRFSSKPNFRFQLNELMTRNHCPRFVPFKQESILLIFDRFLCLLMLFPCLVKVFNGKLLLYLLFSAAGKEMAKTTTGLLSLSRCLRTHTSFRNTPTRKSLPATSAHRSWEVKKKQNKNFSCCS